MIIVDTIHFIVLAKGELLSNYLTIEDTES